MSGRDLWADEMAGEEGAAQVEAPSGGRDLWAQEMAGGNGYPSAPDQGSFTDGSAPADPEVHVAGPGPSDTTPDQYEDLPTSDPESPLKTLARSAGETFVPHEFLARNPKIAEFFGGIPFTPEEGDAALRLRDAGNEQNPGSATAGKWLGNAAQLAPIAGPATAAGMLKTGVAAGAQDAMQSRMQTGEGVSAQRAGTMMGLGGVAPLVPGAVVGGAKLAAKGAAGLGKAIVSPKRMAGKLLRGITDEAGITSQAAKAAPRAAPPPAPGSEPWARGVAGQHAGRMAEAEKRAELRRALGPAKGAVDEPKMPVMNRPEMVAKQRLAGQLDDRGADLALNPPGEQLRPVPLHPKGGRERVDELMGLSKQGDLAPHELADLNRISEGAMPEEKFAETYIKGGIPQKVIAERPLRGDATIPPSSGNPMSALERLAARKQRKASGGTEPIPGRAEEVAAESAQRISDAKPTVPVKEDALQKLVAGMKRPARRPPDPPADFPRTPPPPINYPRAAGTAVRLAGNSLSGALRSSKGAAPNLAGAIGSGNRHALEDVADGFSRSKDTPVPGGNGSSQGISQAVRGVLGQLGQISGRDSKVYQDALKAVSGGASPREAAILSRKLRAVEGLNWSQMDPFRPSQAE